MKKIAYIYNNDIINYNYGIEHPMKPKRLDLTHGLVLEYNLLDDIDIYKAPYANFNNLNTFHNDEYLNFVKNYYSTEEEYNKENKYGISLEDAPNFPGFYNFSSAVAGSSLLSSQLIIDKKYDIVINWMGGLHHAKKSKASGFCYINDIVLGIQKLLTNFVRVLYIDIDVHHGDGVEEAFYNNNRVMTFSVHQFEKDFFPGTGNLDNIGRGYGKYHSVNLPLKSGINDDQYREAFNPILEKIIKTFNPSVIWLQCGADSIIGDDLGKFNLSIKGHSSAIEEVLKYNIPTIIVGGGGYNIENVARCWTYETSRILKKEINNEIPSTYDNFKLFKNDPYIFYKECYKILHTNKNTVEELNDKKMEIIQNLNNLDWSPNNEIPDSLQNNYKNLLKNYNN